MSMTSRARCLLIVCAALGMLSGATIAAPQVPNLPSARLSKASGLKCVFPTLATGTWKNGVSEAAVRPAKLAIGFTSIDTQDGTAEAAGASAKSNITVRLVGNYLHFMQMDAYGAMYVTTVFDQDSKGGRLLASHSRHEYTPVSLPGLTSRPEQYYGDCETLSK
jgi:hypothetical protein